MLADETHNTLYMYVDQLYQEHSSYTEKQNNEVSCGDIGSCSCTGDQSLICMIVEVNYGYNFYMQN